MRTRLATGLALLALVLAAGSVGGYLWWRARPAALPEIPLDNLEPAVADAVKMGRAGVEKEPHSAAAWGLLARILHANDMPAQYSLPCFAEAERLDPQDPRWPYFRGGILQSQDKIDEAIPALQRAVDLCDHTENAPHTPRLLLAEILLSREQSEAAERHFQQVLKAAPTEPRAHFGIAQLAYNRGQWKTCRQHLELCMGTPQASKKAASMLATVCAQLGDRRNADKYANLAAHLPRAVGWPDPYRAENSHLTLRKTSQYQLVEQLEAEKQFSEAVEIVARLAASYPDDYLPHLMLGRLLPQMGQFEEGEKHIRKAKQLAPDKMQVDYLLALIQYRRAETLWVARGGDNKEARALFEEAIASTRKVLAKKADFGFAHMVLGQALKYLGRDREALAAFREALHCNPEFADNHLNLGLALAADESKLDEAISHLEDAQLLAGAADPRPAEALRYLRPRARARKAASQVERIQAPLLEPGG